MLQRYLSNRFVTMKGTVNFERLTCSNQHYMRITLNDAVYRKFAYFQYPRLRSSK